MDRERHPRNQWISNGRLADWYLWSLRRRVWIVRKAIGLVLGVDIDCPIPKRLFMPHPFGIIVGTDSVLGENVTLMHQVTLGGKDPWCKDDDLTGDYPVLEEGVYVGAGAKILGPVHIGEWAIVGANAVVTKNVPAGATVIGFNHIIRKRPQNDEARVAS